MKIADDSLISNSMFTNLDLGVLVFAEPPELAEPPGLEET